jgi:hypothetical protein
MTLTKFSCVRNGREASNANPDQIGGNSKRGSSHSGLAGHKLYGEAQPGGSRPSEYLIRGARLCFVSVYPFQLQRVVELS